MNKCLSKNSVITEGEPQPPPAKTNLTSTVPQDSSEATATRICKRQSKVHLMPFQVQLTRLSDKELEKYLHSYDTKPASTISSSLRLSPIATRSLTRSKQPQRKKRLISGHPSKINDTTAVIEQITSEVDLIERQLKRSGMYPLPPTPLPSVSGFFPRPSPTFKPIPPKGQPTVMSP